MTAASAAPYWVVGMKKHSWKRTLLIAAAALILIALCCVLSLYVSANGLIVTRYRIFTPLEQPMRLVQLSDLHNREFGEDNGRLLKRVRALRPDLILMTGDMINADDPDLSTLLELTRNLSEIAPVYCCYGNHEQSWMRRFSADLRPCLEEAGATVLDAEYLDLEYCGNEFRLGGYAGYYRAPVMTSHGDRQQEKRELQFARDFEHTERYRILLNHIPTAWLDWEYRDDYDVDLVFCGHYHGGLVRFPLIGGLYAPNIGFFPKYSKGIFPNKPATVVLSAGLGSDHSHLRFNNPGEIVCVDLLPEK